MARSKKWKDLSPTTRRGLAAAGALEVLSLSGGLLDLHRRTAGQVRGPRLLWAAAMFIQPVGPLAYLLVGRRRGGEDRLPS